MMMLNYFRKDVARHNIAPSNGVAGKPVPLYAKSTRWMGPTEISSLSYNIQTCNPSLHCHQNSMRCHSALAFETVLCNRSTMRRDFLPKHIWCCSGFSRGYPGSGPSLAHSASNDSTFRFGPNLQYGFPRWIGMVTKISLNTPFGTISTPPDSFPWPAIAIGQYTLHLDALASNDGFLKLPNMSPSLRVFS